MIRELNGKKPKIHPTAFIHETAEIIGDVTIEKDASVWPYCVLRGDFDAIVVGEGSNVQDNTVAHTIQGKPVVLGKGISVGHSVILHGCTVKDNCIVGMGSIVLDGATVEADCLVGAGAVVSPNTTVASGHLALGIPARSIRKLKPEEVEHIRENAREYLRLSELHRKTSRRVF